MAEIKQLIDNDSELKIYPITSTAAVLDNDGVNVLTILDGKANSNEMFIARDENTRTHNIQLKPGNSLALNECILLTLKLNLSSLRWYFTKIDDNELSYANVVKLFNNPHIFITIKYIDEDDNEFYFYKANLGSTDINVDPELSTYKFYCVPTESKIYHLSIYGDNDIEITNTNIDLASAEAFIVNITDSNGTFISNKTYSQIVNAYNSRRTVFAVYYGQVYQLFFVNENGIKFVDLSQMDVEDRMNVFYINTSNSVSYDEMYYQRGLVSGTSIKTINNQSLLGSGNLTASDVGAEDRQKVVVKITNISVNNVPTFVDANNNALTHAQVKDLLDNLLKDVIIYWTSNNLFYSLYYAESGDDEYYFSALSADDSYVYWINLTWDSSNNTFDFDNGNYTMQQLLVSGTNIKTINNQSLLGSGNLTASDIGALPSNTHIPNDIKVGSVAGKLYRNDVNGGGNFTVKGNSGCIPNLTAGTFLVSVYAKSSTQSYSFRFNFGSVTYDLSTTNGEINDVRQITIPSNGTFSGSVLNGSVAPGTILYVVMYDYLTPVSTVGIAAVTNRHSDLDGIPNGTLTIQKNGTTVGTFTANQSSNTTANITVPTTASDIGAMSTSHPANAITSVKITEWDGKMSTDYVAIKMTENNGTLSFKNYETDATLTHTQVRTLLNDKTKNFSLHFKYSRNGSDVSTYGNIQLDRQEDYWHFEHIDDYEYAMCSLGWDSTNNEIYIDELIGSYFADLFQEQLISGTNIKTINNQSLLGSGNLTPSQIGVPSIANNLTTTTAGSALDATQGKALKDLVDGKISTQKFIINLTLDANDEPVFSDASNNTISTSSLWSYLSDESLDALLVYDDCWYRVDKGNNSSKYWCFKSIDYSSGSVKWITLQRSGMGEVNFSTKTQSFLTSHQTLKTIDSQSLLGIGNIAIRDSVFGKLTNGRFYVGTWSTLYNTWLFMNTSVTINREKTYIDVLTNKAYIYDGSSFVELNEVTVPDELADLADDSTHRLVTDTEKSTWNAKADPVPIVTVSTTGAVTQALDPNKFYKFTGSPTSLTVTLNSGLGLCVYAGKFTAGTGFSDFTLPSGVAVAVGAPTIEAGETYEFNIADNLIVIVKQISK